VFLHTLGNFDTGIGFFSLSAQPYTGGFSTAIGFGALQANAGLYNTASGFEALQANSTGSNNTANGVGALYGNTLGSSNTASGYEALLQNVGGTFNTAVGQGALQSNVNGFSNTAIGVNAGQNIVNSNNVDIGNSGVSGDNGIIRIGASGTHVAFYAAGISGTTTGGSAVQVVIDGNGQLGTISSSRRFKEDIHDMGDASSNLLRLRPVTYRYKQPYADGSKPIDYGLIAEEVAEVYPDLVVRNKDGQVETVQYQKLTPMLLNELQRQQAEIRRLEEELAKLEAALASMSSESGVRGRR